MAEFIAEFIFEAIINVLLYYPGASIRWLFLRKSKSFSELLDDEYSVLNSFVATLFIALIVVAVFIIKYYFKS